LQTQELLRKALHVHGRRRKRVEISLLDRLPTDDLQRAGHFGDAAHKHRIVIALPEHDAVHDGLVLPRSGIEHVLGKSQIALAGTQNLLRVGAHAPELEQRDQPCEKKQDHDAEKTHQHPFADSFHLSMRICSKDTIKPRAMQIYLQLPSGSI